MKLSEALSRHQIKFIPDEEGSIIVRNQRLTSLKGSPEIVKGNFDCCSNDLTTLQYGPKVVYGWYNCTNNRITSLHNIHKYIKRLTSLSFGYQPKVLGNHISIITSDKVSTPPDKTVYHLLGLCLIEGLKEIRCTNIINDLFKQYGHDVLLFQDALIEAGYVEQAKF